MSDEVAPVGLTAKEPKKTDKKSKRPLWLKIVLGVAAFIVIIVVFAFVATNAPAKVSNEFLNDIQAQQADQAYSLFSKEAKEATDQASFKETVGRIGPLLNTKEKQTGREVKDSTGSPASAQVKYEIKGTDGIDYEITIQLVKQDDQWKGTDKGI